MKKKTNITTVYIIAIITLLSGCRKEYFDTQPDNFVTIDKVFSNRGQTERWLAGLYSFIPDHWNIDNFVYVFSTTTDELDAGNWNTPLINSGALNAVNTPSRFTSYYQNIRLASIFLENVDRNTEILALDNGRDLIKQYKGEAQFLRAYYYWLMMKELGPVVIVPLKSISPTDDLQIPRSSWDECVEFVLKEIREAKNNLPVDNYLPGSTAELDKAQTGRINKIIAAAVESQILLYHASPLYNGNTDMGDFRNLDGKHLINQVYDRDRWVVAAEAAKAAIDIAEIQGRALYQVNDPNLFRAAFLSCRDLFWNGCKTEGIWLRPQSGYELWERTSAPRSIQGTAFNGHAVVQRLVDDFRMNDGSSINANANYRENEYTTMASPYYVAGTNSMYTNREARFYVDVTFNGAVNPGVAKAGAENARVEFFNTGSSGKAGAPRDWPKTGYTARKNIPPTYSKDPYSSIGRPTMVIRLAELYLNYAEALNEADPTNPDILRYLNRVRTRGGLPEIQTVDQVRLRDEIRLERRIELCFEGHRYFDVRRWKIADKPGSDQGGVFYGMNMDAGTSLSDPAFHIRTVAFSRAAWQRRFYFLPYGQNEMDRNKSLVQFPGY
ncbi:RagB/SusD family nutrient uptake outer membrane protein [Desertivirga xinjiangensis]|uniref:RagB/SusD family nutrient uptake outer membrane protein n=1 Tax=Desertivirga xinjiangensis TaxID=539206 RepID=UPI00210A6CC9|nr:RagB/SusD family nutrient uptake outer membrane protein [Pedobacter xinjiangensis]